MHIWNTYESLYSWDILSANPKTSKDISELWKQGYKDTSQRKAKKNENDTYVPEETIYPNFSKYMYIHSRTFKVTAYN